MDPGRPRGPGPPAPVKTSQKEDGHCVGPQVLQVIGPPSDKFLDLLLTLSLCLFRLWPQGNRPFILIAFNIQGMLSK